MIIERDLFAKIKSHFDSPEAIVITGMRRTGKTTLLHFIMDSIKSDNKIFLDLENPLNQKYLDEKNYDKISDNFRFLGLNLKEKGYVFLDEIQFVKKAPSIVKYLIDHYNIKFFLTGSASFYLKNLFSESLAGRKYIFELFPLSFLEFLKLKNVGIKPPKIKTGNKISEAQFCEINRYYDEFILYGGFPGVVQKETALEKKMALEDIFSSYFRSEIKQLGDFRKTSVVRDLIFLLLERTGSKVDIQKLSRELGVSRDTVYNYMSFLEQTYFIKLVRPFSRNRDSEIRSTPKFYVCDTGLLNQFSKVTEGEIFENAVFSAIRLKGEINYYQRKNGTEIDFVLDKKYAYEVKISADKQDVKKIAVVSKTLKLKNFAVISRKQSGLSGITYGFLL
jgi:predicted AAA+ superfamily ATPase